MAVEIAAEPMDERHGAEPGAGRSLGAALADRGLHCAQEHGQQAADDFRLVAQVPPDPLGHRQHPLAMLPPGQDLIDQVRGDLDHAPRCARRAQITTCLRADFEQSRPCRGRSCAPQTSLPVSLPWRGSPAENHPRNRLPTRQIRDRRSHLNRGRSQLLGEYFLRWKRLAPRVGCSA